MHYKLNAAVCAWTSMVRQNTLSPPTHLLTISYSSVAFQNDMPQTVGYHIIMHVNYDKQTAGTIFDEQNDGETAL